MSDSQKLGELIGSVDGLKSAFSAMQKAQEVNRAEFMDIFKQMRDSMKDVATGFQQHLKEDSIIHSEVYLLQEWKDGKNGNGGVSAQIETMWDNGNKQEGAFGMGKWVAGIIGGLVVAIANFLVNQHGGSKP